MHFSVGPGIYNYKAVYPSGTVIVSSTLGYPPAVNFSKLAFGAGVYVALVSGSQYCYTSNNGYIWTASTMPGGAAGYWSDVVYSGTQFVAVALGTIGGVSMVATSSDGITWTQRNTPYVWASIAYGNSTYVANNVTNTQVTNVGGTSPDGVNWTMQSMINTSTNYNGLAFGNGVFVGTSATLNGAASNRSIYSTNGSSWSSYLLPSTATWMGVDYSNGKFLAYTNGTTAVASSTNGMNWTALTVAAGSGPSTYGSSGWAMVKFNTAATSSVSLSTDGVTWTTVPNALPAATWKDVIYGSGKYVFISTNGVSAVLTFTVAP